MFVLPNHQELKHNVWCQRLELLSPTQYVFGALNDLIDLPSYPVRFICLLRGAINGNNQSVEA